MKICIFTIISVLFILGLAIFVYGDGADLTVEVLGSAPYVDNVDVNDANPISGNITQIRVASNITDTNGIDDIDVVTMQFTVGTPANGNSITGITCSDIDFDTKECVATYNMQFYDPALTYTVEVYAEDISGASDTNTGSFAYAELIALELDATTIEFGSMIIGQQKIVDGDQNMGTTDSATIKNQGNGIIDASISATDFSGTSDSFGANQAQSKFGSLSYVPLSNSPGRTETNLNLGVGANVFKNLDFKLIIPTGALPESYSSTVSVVAVANS